MDLPIARAAALDVRPVAPDAVGQAGELLQECLLAVVEDFPHHALDGLGSISFYQRQNSVPRREVARELGAEIERHRARLPGTPQVDLFDIAADLVVLDDLYRRDQDSLVESIARRRAERARRDAADVVLVQAVGDPAEQLA